MDEQEKCEDVKFVMAKIPSWIVRWGVTVIFFMLASIIVGSYFVKYPDRITSNIAITTINPPSDLVAKSNGLVCKVFVVEGEHVSKGQILAVLDNSAKWEDVLFLQHKMSGMCLHSIDAVVCESWISKKYNVGEMQQNLEELQNVCSDYHQLLKADGYIKKRNLLKEQIGKNKEYYDKLKVQGGFLAKEVNLERKQNKRDSFLLVKKSISESDFDDSMKKLLLKQYDKYGFDANLIQTQLQILQCKNQMGELEMQKKRDTDQYRRKILALTRQLLASIELWKQNYVFCSPIDGTITFGSIWAQNQYISIGERFATIVSSKKMKVIGKLQIPSEGFGKVKVGQTVLVKLNGYPYMEYGVLKGQVESISKSPDIDLTTNGISYAADVKLPDKLETTYRKKLHLIQKMNGEADIITDDIRLLEQFVKPIISLFKN